MLADNPILVFSLILLGLVTGPWIFWYLFAVTATWIQRKLIKRDLRIMYRNVVGYDPETKVATIKDWPPKDPRERDI
jgi:hypothetical protein